MKKALVSFCALASLFLSFPSHAQEQQEQEEGAAVEEGYYGAEEREGDRNGWFLGSDQGVLFFVGDGGDFLNLQYYYTIFGGYNFKGIFQPMIRLGQAIGSANGFFDPTTFFFILEGGFRVTPIRYKFRPYFVGSAGMYVLSFDDFGFPIQDQVNFTYSGGGGLEYSFGANTLFLGSAYRGFINGGLDFSGVEVTLGYAFQF